jgi:hypothetical protein
VVCVFAHSKAFAKEGDMQDIRSSNFEQSMGWCDEISHLHPSYDTIFPDGALMPVGPYFFRVCRGATVGSSSNTRVMRLFFNEKRVPFLQRSDSMTGLMINNLTSWEMKQETFFKSHENIGEKNIGGITYEVFKYFDGVNSTLSHSESYWYNSDLDLNDTNLPSHMLSCSGRLDFTNGRSSICHLDVEYDQMWGSRLLIGGGPSAKPFPIEDIPILAQDIFRILEAADATSEFEILRETLPVLE